MSEVGATSATFATILLWERSQINGTLEVVNRCLCIAVVGLFAHKVKLTTSWTRVNVTVAHRAMRPDTADLFLHGVFAMIRTNSAKTKTARGMGAVLASNRFMPFRWKTCFKYIKTMKVAENSVHKTCKTNRKKNSACCIYQFKQCRWPSPICDELVNAITAAVSDSACTRFAGMQNEYLHQNISACKYLPGNYRPCLQASSLSDNTASLASWRGQ